MNLQIGDRVGFSADFLNSIRANPTEGPWHKYGVVVGFLGDRLVRVKFDGENTPCTMAACNLAKPGTIRYANY